MMGGGTVVCRGGTVNFCALRRLLIDFGWEKGAFEGVSKTHQARKLTVHFSHHTVPSSEQKKHDVSNFFMALLRANGNVFFFSPHWDIDVLLIISHSVFFPRNNKKRNRFTIPRSAHYMRTTCPCALHEDYLSLVLRIFHPCNLQ